MKVNRIVLLTLIIVLLTSTVCFAGSWYNDPFEHYFNPGTSTWTVEEFTCTNMPCLDFWVNPSSGTKTVTVKLYTWEYMKVGGVYQWTWKLVQTNTHTVASGKTAHFSDWSNVRLYYKGKYEITYSGSYGTLIDGTVKYYY